MRNPSPFKWRHFEAEIILLCVSWYVRYSLSYRNLEEVMRERGLLVDHSTIYRWVQHSAPEIDKRCRPHLKATNDSWKVDEMGCGAKNHQGGRNVSPPFLFSFCRSSEEFVDQCTLASHVSFCCPL